MIERLSPIQFDRKAATGRTGPGFIVCEDMNEADVEVVVKLSSGCDRAETSLAMEVMCACLAGDLGLPIPQPYLVQMDPDWIESVNDHAWAQRARASSSVAFGSKRVPAGFGQWVAGTSMVEPLSSSAAAILLFDAIVDNPDRRGENPNCLQRGDQLRIIDHELCFGPLIIGWKPPWMLAALQHFETPGAHIFRDALHRRAIEWEPIAAPWKELSDAQIADYEAAIPAEWAAALPAVRTAIDKIKSARDHIDECVSEVQRVLT